MPHWHREPLGAGELQRRIDLANGPGQYRIAPGAIYASLGRPVRFVHAACRREFACRPQELCGRRTTRGCLACRRGWSYAELRAACGPRAEVLTRDWEMDWREGGGGRSATLRCLDCLGVWQVEPEVPMAPGKYAHRAEGCGGAPAGRGAAAGRRETG